MPDRVEAIKDAATQLKGVREDLTALTGAIDKLASKEDLAGEAKSARKWQGWIVLALLLVMAIGLSLVFLVKQASNQADFNGVAAVLAADQAAASEQVSRQTKRIAQNLKATNDILIECTTPSTKNDTHECYEATLANQQTSVGQINVVSMAAVSCANAGNPEIGAVRKCVHAIITDGDQG